MWRKVFVNVIMMLVFYGILMSGCGQKDPDIVIPGDSGILSVSSVPDSASVFLDDSDTGFLTPATFTAVSPGTHEVRVARNGFTSRPESLLVEIEAGQTTTASFQLDPIQPRPLLLESFTNVSCGPCAEANPMMYGLMEELGSEHAVLLEFHTYFPSPLDPYYLEQRTLMDTWILRYGVTQAPWLVVEGVEGLQPATEDGVRDILNALEPSEDVVFTLTGIRNAGSLSCSLGAVTTGDAGTYNIIVLVTQDSREFDEPPGSNGETLFRHAVRGAMPNAAGEDTELTSLAAVWFEWQTDLAWMEFGGPVRLHALARKQGEQRVVGLSILDIP